MLYGASAHSHLLQELLFLLLSSSSSFRPHDLCVFPQCLWWIELVSVIEHRILFLPISQLHHFLLSGQRQWRSK